MAKQSKSALDTAKAFAKEAGIENWALVYKGGKWEMIKISASVKPVAVLTGKGWV